MEVNANMIAKQVVKKIPTGLIVGAAALLVIASVVYVAWEETDPNKSINEKNAHEDKANIRNQTINDQRDALFEKIVSPHI